jgi:hypothetical protein
MQLLMRIWASVMTDRAFPGHDHSDWECEIGFQGKQPQTDLRKMGIFALEQLAYVPLIKFSLFTTTTITATTTTIIIIVIRYFAEHYSERFDGMRRFGDGCGYPASSVSVNISDLVLSLLNCSTGPVQEMTASKGAFMLS